MAQSELANRSGLGRGFVSRIVRRLSDDALLEAGPKGTVRVKAPSVLLDAWRADYEFAKHHVVRVTVPSKNGADLTRSIAQPCKRAGLDHAFTGLGAAWVYDSFAVFRLVTVYVHRPQDVDRVLGLDAVEDSRGANLWVVVPNDAGVFDGADEIGGVRCVSRIQAWLDLHAMPERAPETADRMRSVWLKEIRRA